MTRAGEMQRAGVRGRGGVQAARLKHAERQLLKRCQGVQRVHYLGCINNVSRRRLGYSHCVLCCICSDIVLVQFHDVKMNANLIYTVVVSAAFYSLDIVQCLCHFCKLISFRPKIFFVKIFSFFN